MIPRHAIAAVFVCTALALAANPPGGGQALAQQQAGAQETQQPSAKIELLEQRVRDLQAVVGTLQTFVRDSGAATAPDAAATVPAAPGGGAPNELSIRVLALETQIKALTGQMEEVLQRLNQEGASQGRAVPGATPGAAPERTMPWQQSGAEIPGQAPPPPGPPIAAGQAQPPQRTAGLPPTRSSTPGQGGARGVYEASYQSFVRNDLAGAERGFKSFVRTYPDDPLATNAYYWLGRSHYDRKQYEPAAKAFLAGYKKDKKGAIAPDSLLHLGLSLAQLGEKDAACSTLGAVSRQYPDAPEQLRQSAANALKKTGC